MELGLSQRCKLMVGLMDYPISFRWVNQPALAWRRFGSQRIMNLSQASPGKKCVKNRVYTVYIYNIHIYNIYNIYIYHES